MRAGSGHARQRPDPAGRGPAAARRAGNGIGPEEHERLTGLAGHVVRAGGMDLESVHVTPAGRRRVLKVIVDADGGVGLDEMAEISRALSTELDASGAMGDSPYTLEVSSPGVDRPLTQPRHWRRAVGRLVSVPLTADEPEPEAERNAARALQGRVVTAGEDGVVLDIDGEHRTFGYNELGTGRIELEFGRGDRGERDGH